MTQNERQETPPWAAIDLGTNTVLLLVARVDAAGALEVLEDQSRTVRLGEGLAGTGHLAPAAVERTLAALAGLLERAELFAVPRARLRAVGTAVLRRAADAEGFLERCRNDLDLAIDVLGESEEARLGYEAVAAECPAPGAAGSSEIVLVDVGGGSTEVVADRGRARLSAPVGALVLTEAFLGFDGRPPVRAGGWRALRAAVDEACTRFPSGAAADLDVAAIGGTASNLACLDLALERFDPARAEGHVVGAAAADRWAEELASRDPADRRRLPIEGDRAEILPAGLACLAGTLERLGAGGARVTGRGLRYGVLRELAGPRPAGC